MSITEYIGSVVNFDTAAPGILGTNRRNVQVLAVLDMDTAAMMSDVRARHAQVKNYIQDLPEAASSYNYVKIRYTNGDIEVLGVPWIKHDTIEVVTSRKLVITVNNVTDTVENTVKQALLQNGIEFSIEQIGTVTPPQ